MLCAVVLTCQAQAPQLPPPEVMADTLLIKLNERVELTPAQYEAIAPVIAAHVETQHELMADAPKGLRGMLKMRKRMKRLMGDTNKQIEPLLTAAQQEAYKGFWEEQRAAFRQQMKARDAQQTRGEG